MRACGMARAWLVSCCMVLLSPGIESLAGESEVEARVRDLLRKSDAELVGGQWDRAEATLLTALAKTEDEPSVHHLRGRVLRSLGTLYTAQGETESAGRYFTMAVEESEHDHVELLESLRALHRLRRSEGDPYAEEEILRRIVETQRAAGARSYEIAPSFVALGRSYRERGETDRAQESYTIALGLLDEHPERNLETDRARIRIALAELDVDRGRSTQAEEALRREISFLERQQPYPSAELLEAMALYASLLRETGRGREAEIYDQRRKELLQAALHTGAEPKRGP